MSATNKNLYSPTVKAFAFDDDLSQTPLCALDIFGDGVVDIIDTEGTTISRSFVGVSPYRWWINIRKVKSTSTMAIGDLTGLH